MKNIRSAFGLFLLSVLLASCSMFTPLRHPGQCLPAFPDRDGWYGADGAYSIPLDHERTLWLFGDTFVSGDENRKDRIGMDVVMGTTLAVSTCAANTGFKIRYYLKKKDGKFVSSFGEDEWLWPQDPFIARGILHIPLLVIRNVPEGKPPFNFKITGLKMAVIKDFQAENPDQWPVDYADWTDVTAPGIEALATTSVVYRNYVYFYPLYRKMTDNVRISGNILARISVDHLNRPAGHLEYWTRKGWQKDWRPAEVELVFRGGLSELSVRYHARDREWLAVYLSPENRGNKLFGQTAPNPEGPWSRPFVLIDNITEVDPASPLYHPHTFCYAGKEHDQYAYDKNIVVTYVCNSTEDVMNPASFLRRNLFLYRPIVQTIGR